DDRGPEHGRPAIVAACEYLRQGVREERTALRVAELAEDLQAEHPFRQAVGPGEVPRGLERGAVRAALQLGDDGRTAARAPLRVRARIRVRVTGLERPRRQDTGILLTAACHSDSVNARVRRPRARYAGAVTPTTPVTHELTTDRLVL